MCPPLFLTSKVRLHCDIFEKGLDLLRDPQLFLTSKVRLHCDLFARPGDGFYGPLFLTSKVRLHCDR